MDESLVAFFDCPCICTEWT